MKTYLAGLIFGISLAVFAAGPHLKKIFVSAGIDYCWNCDGWSFKPPGEIPNVPSGSDKKFLDNKEISFVFIILGLVIVVYCFKQLPEYPNKRE